MKLPEEGPDTVAHYLDHVYGKGLPTDSFKQDTCPGEVYDVLTEMFALGERLQDVEIRNVIIKEIFRFTTVGHHYYPDARHIRNIYECTTANSPARRMMVDMFVYVGGEHRFVEDHHPVFLQELARVLMREMNNSTLPCRSQKLVARDYVI